MTPFYEGRKRRLMHHFSAAETAVLDEGYAIMQRHFKRGEALASPGDTGRYLKMNIGPCANEIFGVLYLDNRHRPLADVQEFFGTIDGTSVHPRAIVQRALELNAAACIAYHNHPSGVNEPSQADRSLTRRLQESLNLVDIRLLDHIVIGADAHTSFAERGWL